MDKDCCWPHNRNQDTWRNNIGLNLPIGNTIWGFHGCSLGNALLVTSQHTAIYIHATNVRQEELTSGTAPSPYTVGPPQVHINRFFFSIVLCNTLQKKYTHWHKTVLLVHFLLYGLQRKPLTAIFQSRGARQAVCAEREEDSQRSKSSRRHREPEHFWSLTK